MSRATVRLLFLMVVSISCASAIRQPLAVQEAVGPTTLSSAAVVPVDIAPTTVVEQEASNSIEPAMVAPGTVDPSFVPADNVVVTTADAADSAAVDAATVSAQQAAPTPTPVTAFAGKTLGIGYSGSGYLVS